MSARADGQKKEFALTRCPVARFHLHPGLQDTRKRVVGILLGEYQKGRLDVTNSYAGAFENLLRGGSLFPRASFLTCAACHASRRPVPFEEDDRDSSIWFLDHSYHEQMYRMARRINGERVSLLRH